jgi:beta-alanine degradation protein BauB
MKKLVLVKLLFIVLLTILNVQFINAQEKTEPWPGVTRKVLTDNDKVTVSEVTFAPGAVADWHSHQQHSVYVITDLKMKVEVKDQEPTIVEFKAGQAGWSEAVTHKTTNVGKKPFKVIVTELK